MAYLGACILKKSKPSHRNRMRMIAIKRRAAGMLPTKKELRATNEFYKSVFADPDDDAAIIRENRKLFPDAEPE